MYKFHFFGKANTITNNKNVLYVFHPIWQNL